MRAGRDRHARGGDHGRFARRDSGGGARVLAGAAGGGARGGRGHARRRRVPFRAEARGGKVARRKGAALGRAVSATRSRFPAPAATPWTTSVSERRPRGATAKGARPRAGRARAGEWRAESHLPRPGSWFWFRLAGALRGLDPRLGLSPGPGQPRRRPLSSQPPAASTAPPPDPQPRGSSPISQSNPRDELAGQGPSVSASGTGPPLRDVTIFPAMGPSLHRLLPHPHRTNGTPNLGISCLISQDGPSIPGPASTPSEDHPRRAHPTLGIAFPNDPFIS